MNFFWGIINYISFIIFFSLSIMGIIVVKNTENSGLIGIGVLFLSIVFLFISALLIYHSPLPKQNSQIFKKKYIRNIFTWVPYIFVYFWGILILYFEFAYEGFLYLSIFMFMFPIFYKIVKEIDESPNRKWLKKRKNLHTRK